jgi:dienelactone hydrolase
MKKHSKLLLAAILTGVFMCVFSGCKAGGLPPAESGGVPPSGGTENEADAARSEAYSLLKNSGQFEYEAYTLMNAEYPLSGYPGISAIEFPSVRYKDGATNVFGYLGIPAGASAANKVPGVVLVHGGNGTAFPQWVKKWNDAGYAALAIDTEGSRPNGSRTGLGGPANDGMFTGALPIEEQWMYHALSAVIKAHTVLRALPYVDSEKTGVTGISWGGIITSSVIGIDNRFKFAVPVYGAGFLSEGKSTYNGTMYEEHRAALNLWDPSNWFPRVDAATKVLFLNSDVDNCFSLNLTSRSSAAVAGSQMSTHNAMPHGHIEGWEPPEVIAFADEAVKGRAVFAQITAQPDASAGRAVRLVYSVPAGAAHTVEVYGMAGDYSFTPGMPYVKVRDFAKRAVAVNDANGTITFTLPAEDTNYYVNIKTGYGSSACITSTRLVSL